MDDLMGRIQDVLSDEESMNQIKKLASMFGGDENSSAPDLSSIFNGMNSNSGSKNTSDTGNSDFDLSKLIVLKDIMQKANKPDPSTDLLYSLRPLVKTETQEKIDKLLKIFKIIAIWPVIKDSGVLGGDLFGLL